MECMGTKKISLQVKLLPITNTTHHGGGRSSIVRDVVKNEKKETKSDEDELMKEIDEEFGE